MQQLGDYRLRKRLAVGGMGEVYLGEKVGPEGFVKPVVLKCVLPQLASDQSFVQLFLDEARLAALLNHPNIAQVYDFGLVDNVYYIAMEYVPGYTVDDIRRKLKSINRWMPLEHVACIASQVCQGLHYAHILTDAQGVSLGLVHRDVSPHNLIVSVEGSVKIVDFGIAKARAGLTRVQAKGAVGKFGYMSPEQSRGAPVDGRSDLFSLGVCLWELATNERLHDPHLSKAPAYSATRPIRSTQDFRPEVPRQFQEILETALSIHQEDRYPSCKEMHLAFERFQAAMTHYAGQSALAQYIKDLVEGRIEHPGSTPSGYVVEPAVAPPSSAALHAGPHRPTGDLPGMGAAQKYEEVFGVTMEKKRAKSQLKAFPASWQTKERPPPGEPAAGPNPADVGHRVVQFEAPDVEPSLELDDGARVEPKKRARPLAEFGATQRTTGDLRRPTQRTTGDLRRPAPAPHAGPPASRAPWMVVAMLAAIAGGGAYAYLAHGHALSQFLGLAESPTPASFTSAYRIDSEPPGAEVFLDGKRVEGVTPVEVNLIPDVEYRITVKQRAWATKETRVTATLGTEVRVLPFTLEEAGSLRIRTVPPGASISVDGRVISDRVSPMTLRDVPANRPIKVTASLKGMRSLSKTIQLEKGRKKSVRLELSR